MLAQRGNAMSQPLNTNLNQAGKAKMDEFYTQLVDIERELTHYQKQFRGKVVYCNCDDPFESNFFRYFATNFNALKLKKLIATSYVKSPIVGGELPLFDMEGLKPEGREPFKIEINEVKDLDADGAIGIKDVELLIRSDANVSSSLKGDGDFRSEECIELLKEADVVVTNPPFSLFREYVAQLIEYKKKFVIIGNKNAVTYKETFKWIKENKLWVGNTPMGIDMLFDVSKDYASELVATKKEGSAYKIINGVVKARAQAVWFTNLSVEKRQKELTLFKKYTPKEYPKYDNYNAINVERTVEIPMGYKGVMGVPITFLDKHNPEQFEILGIANSARWIGYECLTKIKGKNIYNRILIKARAKK